MITLELQPENQTALRALNGLQEANFLMLEQVLNVRIKPFSFKIQIFKQNATDDEENLTITKTVLENLYNHLIKTKKLELDANFIHEVIFNTKHHLKNKMQKNTANNFLLLKTPKKLLS